MNSFSQKAGSHQCDNGERWQNPYSKHSHYQIGKHDKTARYFETETALRHFPQKIWGKLTYLLEWKAYFKITEVYGWHIFSQCIIEVQPQTSWFKNAIYFLLFTKLRTTGVCELKALQLSNWSIGVFLMFMAIWYLHKEWVYFYREPMITTSQRQTGADFTIMNIKSIGQRNLSRYSNSNKKKKGKQEIS